MLRDLIIPLLLRNNFQLLLSWHVTVDCTFKTGEIKAILNYVSGCVAKVIQWTRVKAKWKSQFRQWRWWDSRRFVIAKYFGKFKYIIMWSNDQLIKRSSNLNFISTYSMVLCEIKAFMNSNNNYYNYGDLSVHVQKVETWNKLYLFDWDVYIFREGRGYP